MPTIIPFNNVRGHLIIPLPGCDALVDTGSPVSFGRWPIELAGKRFNLPESMMGLTTEVMAELADMRIDAVVGCDILTNLHGLRIRWNDGLLEFADGFPPGEVNDPLAILAGTPVFPVTINGTATKAIFDTGAHLSYIDPALVAKMVPTGEKDDFHPLNGRFKAPVYNVSTSIDALANEIEYGVLPGKVGMMTSMAMGMAGA
ncbi:MAG: hypothetical protein HGA97_01035 [Chlorobiaceae bacterium]|nr:hypothetical protein [Chlorobiaceae bacterium]